ncbi:AMP-binding protein [Clostridia bacterium OttesenSCG-928-F22]|nr:AMP-binding protein [Clostridia bacterium OttesenSCG-928-F22]
MALRTYSRKGEPRDITYAQLSDDAAAFATALLQKGMSKKHIGIISENSYEWIVAFLGIVASGNVAVCVDIEQTDSTIAAMVRETDAEAVVVSEAMHAVVGEALEDVKELHDVIIINDKDGQGFAEMVALGHEALVKGDTRLEKADVSPQQTAAIVFTSGTTSVSKPVMLSHEGMLYNAYESIGMVKATGMKVFTSLPFCHAYGLTTCIIGNLLAGLHTCINGDLKTTMRDFALFQPQTMMAVPLMVEMIYHRTLAAIEQSGNKDEIMRAIRRNKTLNKIGIGRNGDGLRNIMKEYIGELSLIVCGGAHLSMAIAEGMSEFGVLVLQGYGITECSPLIASNRNEAYKLDSVGLIIPSLEYKVEDGEIMVRGVSVMQGYYKNEELTKQEIVDGWFKTGDLGYLDKNEFLYITGRKKNLIVFKNGKKVSSEEVESYVQGISLVKEVVAYGATSGNSTDDVRLAVTVFPDANKTGGMSSYDILEKLQQEIDVINNSLPSYKQIQMVNIRESEFEKTSSRKIKRQIL